MIKDSLDLYPVPVLFDTYGLSGGTKYTDLTLDYNGVILVFVYLFESMLGEGIFVFVLCATCLALAALYVSKVKTPKLSGNPLNVIRVNILTSGSRTGLLRILT